MAGSSAARPVFEQVARVVVYGSGGSGKSTFAASLAHNTGSPHVEIDLLAYDAEGVHVSQELLRQRFEEALAVGSWIVEGMHRDQLYRALPEAETFIWLDYSRVIIARRLVRRVLRQLLLKEERHGRITTIRSAWQREVPFVKKTIRSHGRRREHGQNLAAKAAALGVEVVRLSSPRQAHQRVSGRRP